MWVNVVVPSSNMPGVLTPALDKAAHSSYCSRPPSIGLVWETWEAEITKPVRSSEPKTGAKQPKPHSAQMTTGDKRSQRTALIPRSNHAHRVMCACSSIDLTPLGNLSFHLPAWTSCPKERAIVWPSCRNSTSSHNE
jgi:hypothetical protein